MAAEKPLTGGEKVWKGVWAGAALFTGIELAAYLINPVFAAGLIFWGAIGGAVAGSIHLINRIVTGGKA